MDMSLWTFSFVWAVIMYDTRSNLLVVLSVIRELCSRVIRLYRCTTLYYNEDLPSLVCNRDLFLNGSVDYE